MYGPLARGTYPTARHRKIAVPVKPKRKAPTLRSIIKQELDRVSNEPVQPSASIDTFLHSTLNMLYWIRDDIRQLCTGLYEAATVSCSTKAKRNIRATVYSFLASLISSLPIGAPTRLFGVLSWQQVFTEKRLYPVKHLNNSTRT